MQENFLQRQLFQKLWEKQGVRGFSPNDIEILNNELGKPYVVFRNNIKDFNNKYFVEISISHCNRVCCFYSNNF